MKIKPDQYIIRLFSNRSIASWLLIFTLALIPSVSITNELSKNKGILNKVDPNDITPQYIIE